MVKTRAKKVVFPRHNPANKARVKNLITAAKTERVVESQDMDNHNSDKNTTKIAQKKNSAGVFSSWLRRIHYMFLSDRGIDVPCGSCRGCCISSKFIHIRPEETATISHIPKQLLFKAPLLPKGHFVMGYGENGHCPMFRGNQCQIYDYRPLACRNYDCRIFCAADLSPSTTESEICKRVKSWRFTYPYKKDRALHQSILSAVHFITNKPHCFPDAKIPEDPSQIALLAIKAHCVFGKKQKTMDRSDEDIAMEIVKSINHFEKKREAFAASERPRQKHPKICPQ